MTSRLPVLLSAVGFAFLLSDRAARSDTPDAAAAPLVMASSHTCDGLRDLVVDTLVHQYVVGQYGYGYGYGYGYYGGGRRPVPAKASRGADEPMPAAPEPAAAPAQVAQPQTQAQPSHYTTTNVQERGVDEGDIVKTDGHFVYTLRNNELVIAKTWPVDKTAVAARVAFKTIYPQQLYLHGDDLIVQGQAADGLEGWNQGRTRVIVIDAREREAPRIRRMFDVEGYGYNSRVVGDDLYLVQTNSVQIPQRLQELAQKATAQWPRADQQSLRPWEIQSRLAATLRRTLLAHTTAADIESALPRVRTNGQVQRMACDDLYVPPNNIQLGLTAVARMSLRDGKADLVGAMVSGGQVYASTNALYLAAPSYTWNQLGYAGYQTAIHEFSLGDATHRPAYVASGTVEGQILNEFSMSEWNGDLRVATTDWMWNGQQGGNQLFVLRPRGHELVAIGALRGLGKGERIYAGRLIGDKGYLVTFRQTDPLFTLDLRDPTNPRVVGELKINGFSSYIHPMGGDLLLAIGQDATDQGRVQGLQLQVFDVKDPAHPTRRFVEKVQTAPGYSWSSAQNDHHAFTYDPVTGTLAFPMYEQHDSTYFNGLAVYHLDRTHGFKRLGRIDHHVIGAAFLDDQCRKNKSTYYCQSPYREQQLAAFPIDRSIVVDKYLLSLSQIGLEIHELGTLDVAATLPWQKVEQIAAKSAL